MKKKDGTQVRGFRVKEDRLDELMNHAANMGISFSDVIQQCVDVGFPIIKRREYYRAKLACVPMNDVVDVVAAAMDKLAEKRGG